MVGTSERPEWIAADVCDVLGIEQPQHVLRRFTQSEKGVSTVHTPGGPQQMLTVTEPGLYRLIFKSRKPEAEAFREVGFKSWSAYCVAGRIEYQRTQADRCIRASELRPKLVPIGDIDWTERMLRELVLCETDNDAKRVAANVVSRVPTARLGAYRRWACDAVWSEIDAVLDSRIPWE